jgi:lipopolysaccharide export LptBFGC system permease protein LptF
MMLPGARVRAIASRWFARTTIERVIDPILADLQSEYGEARARGSSWRARWCVIQGYLDLGRAVLWLGVRNVCDANGTTDLQRIWMVSLAAFAVLTLIWTLPPLLSVPAWRHDLAFAALLSTMVIPQALPVSLPVALTVGVLVGTRGSIIGRRRVWTIIGTAVACAVFVWAAMEWIVPDANQAFRETVARRSAGNGGIVNLARGLNELRLSALGQRDDLEAIRHYHALWALCFAAIPLSLLACAVGAYIRRAVPALLVAIGLSSVYIAGAVWVDTVDSFAGLPPVATAWLPNTLTLLVATAFLLRRPQKGSPIGSGDAWRSDVQR